MWWIVAGSFIRIQKWNPERWLSEVSVNTNIVNIVNIHVGDDNLDLIQQSSDSHIVSTSRATTRLGLANDNVIEAL